MTRDSEGQWRFNDDDREEWVNNDEVLYTWWRLSKMSLRYFVRQKRRDIDDFIRERLS